MAVADPEIFLTRLKIAIGRDDFYAWGRSVGLSDGVWQTLKRGSLPKIETMVKVSEATGQSIDWLLGRDQFTVVAQHKPKIEIGIPVLDGVIAADQLDFTWPAELGWSPEEIAEIATDALNQHRSRGAPQVKVRDDLLAIQESSSEFVYVPRYDVTVSAGPGHWIENGEPAKFMMAFRKHWVEKYLKANPRDLSVVRVHGDSMSPSLLPGDNILVNHAKTEIDDGIFVLRIDDRVIVKRTQYLSKSVIRVMSDNLTYPPYEIDLTKDDQTEFKIIGKVVWFGRQI